MSDRIISMENILYQLEKIARELNQDLSKDTVYYHLTRGQVLPKDRNFKVSSLFSKFIDDFKNKKNIQVFVSPDWQYFCQFKNVKPVHKKELINPIKMYLSVNSENIYKVTSILFNYLEKNNIYHESKIGSAIRNDCIVIRLYSKEDEKNLSEFIKSNDFIQKNLLPQIPFCFQKDGIGYAIDGDLSYNVTVSKFIYRYINDCRHNNEKVSLNGLLNYITNIYNIVFVKKEGIDVFLNNYASHDERNGINVNSLLNNYREITLLVINSIISNNYKTFLDFVDLFNDNELVKQNINYFSRNDNLNKKRLFLDKAIILTYKKYDYGQVIFALKNALESGRFDSFTNEENSRNLLIENLTVYDVKNIIQTYSNGNYTSYIEDLIKSQEKDNITNMQIEILNNAIRKTYYKYGFKQVLSAISNAVYEGDMGYFTNDSGARESLINNLSVYDIKKIVNYYVNGDINKYLTDILGITDELDNGIKK